MTTPLDNLITASVVCLKCGAAYGECDCHLKCSCGWSYEEGKPCGNPNTRRCSSKLSVKCEVCGDTGSLHLVRRRSDPVAGALYAHRVCFLAHISRGSADAATLASVVGVLRRGASLADGGRWLVFDRTFEVYEKPRGKPPQRLIATESLAEAVAALMEDGE